jgi:acyl-CoA thioester hydrolase
MGRNGASFLESPRMKAPPERLNEAVYPYWIEISTRFGDMDVNGHLNNVAFAQFFEDSRVSFNRAMLFEGGWLDPSARDFRVLVAGVDIAYVREGVYGPPVRAGIGVLRAGTSSFALGSAVFQDGQCLAVSDAAVVIKSPAGTLPDELRARLAAQMLRL